jgi:hypothetical protein
MSDSDPVFFFSYDRGTDRLLDDFFQKLKTELARLQPIGEETNGFREDHDIANGDDWNAKIAGALAKSKVLVCIYTAKYFASPFCGREFAAFLKRNKRVRYESVQAPDGQVRYRIRDARNIISILWTGEWDLATHSHKLPPYLLSMMQYAIPQSGLLSDKWLNEYRERGLRLTYSKASRDVRLRFVHHFASAIRDAYTAEPLPSVPLTFDELWDAFREVPEELP